MSTADELRKLHDLLTGGALTPSEYDRAKAVLLAPPARAEPPPPPPPPTPSPPGGETDGQRVALVLMGYVCAAAALLVCPPGFGCAGLVIGVVNVTRRRVGHGLAQIILSLVLGVAGALVGALSAEPGP